MSEESSELLSLNLCSASLFYIVKGGEKMQFNVKVKQRILHTLLVSMMEHKGDATMMRNGCLTLCHFRIPDDLVRYLNKRTLFSKDHEGMSLSLSTMSL